MSQDAASRNTDNLHERIDKILTESAGEPPFGRPAELIELIHALREKQKDLEAQNEELRSAHRREPGAAHERRPDLYELAPVGFVELDGQGIILDANRAASDFVGRRKEDLLRSPIRALIHPDYREVFDLHLRSVGQSGLKQMCEVVLVHGDGTSLDTRVDSISGGSDEHRVIRSVLTDIGDRRASEQELKTGRDLLRAVVEGAPDAVYIKDAGGRYIFINGEAARVMGTEASVAIGKNDDSFTLSDEARRLREVDRSVMTGGKLRTIEETLGTAGQERTFLTTKSPLFDGQGNLSGLFSISHDITGLKRAQKALIDSETKLRQTLKETESLNRDLRHKAEELDTIFNTAPIGIAVSYDPQCLHIKGNAAYASMLGLEVKENLSKTAPAGQRPHNFKEMQDGRPIAPRDLPMQAAAARGVRVGNSEMDLVHDDGRVVHVLGNAAPLLNEHGKSRGAVGAFIDVTQLKRAQEELSRAHRKIAKILESVTDGFVSFDRAWRYTYVNETACRLLQRPREELLGQRALAAFPEGLRLGFRTEFVRAMRENVAVHFEEFFPPLDAWYECRCYPSTEGLSVYFQDITERKRAEQARALHAAKLDTLLDISRDVLAAASSEDMMHRVAYGAMALTGTAQASAGGGEGEGAFRTPLISAVSADSRWPQGELFALDQAARGMAARLSPPSQPGGGLGNHPAWWGVGQPSHSDLFKPFMPSMADRVGDGTAVFQRNEGSFSPEDEAILAQLAAIAALGLRHIEARNEVEELVEERTEELRKAYQALQQELREHKKTEQQLRQAHKMDALGTMASGIGHDFNNILAAMIGFTQLVLDRATQGSKEKDRLQKVLDAGLRGREIVKQMLTFARQGEQETAALQVRSVIEETLKLLKASIPATIDISLAVHGEPGFVLANPAQIRQVVVNLCNNAAQAMDEAGGKLDVELGDFAAGLDEKAVPDMVPGAYMRLTVRDTGKGIAAGDMERIFDPFFTTRKEGSGLGLSVVHGIVRQAGGYVTAASVPGEGSEFSVYLPKIVESRQGTVAEGEVVPTGTERVLFVDDEEPLVLIGRKLLKRLGYKVTGTTSSMEALRLFLTDPRSFDLVITDQTMPAMTGTDLAAKIMAIRPDMPVVLVTGYSHVMDSDSVKAAGIRAFAMKPLTKGEIARTIRRVLDQKGA